MKLFLAFTVFLTGLAMVFGQVQESIPPSAESDPARVTNYWDGSSSTDWHNTANWSLNAVPNSTHAVVVPAGVPNFPLVEAAAACLNLTVNLNAGIGIGSASLYVLNNFNNNGLLMMTSNSSILTVQGNLSFNSGSGTNISAGAGPTLNLTGDLYINSGSSVGITLGQINLVGSNNSLIRTQAAATIPTLNIQKTSPYYAGFASTSSSTLTINGALNVDSGTLKHDYAGTTILRGNLDVDSGAALAFDAGTLSLRGTTDTYLRLVSSANYFHNLQANKSSGSNTVTCYSSLDINGSFTLQNGTFEAPTNIYLAGNWNNLDGPAYFAEGTGTVVLDGSGTQTVSTETFHTLVLDKSAGEMVIPTGSVVNFSSYDWNAGAYTVSGGTFTVDDLFDNGIFGTITLMEGTINYTQDTEGSINLVGNLNISVGNFNVYGGGSDMHFIDYYSVLNMSGGTLDVKNRGILFMIMPIRWITITGGTIRTVGDFTDTAGAFQPSGGFLELYGSQNSTILIYYNNSWLHNLRISKSGASTTVTCMPYSGYSAHYGLRVKNDLELISGTLVAPDSLFVAGDWTQTPGASFNNRGKRVIFNGDAGSQSVPNGLTLYKLEDANTGDGITIHGEADIAQLIVTNSMYFLGGAEIGVVTNESSTGFIGFGGFSDYMISAYTGGGTVSSSHANVTIWDITQANLYGNFIADSGYMDIHQDSANRIDHISCHLSVHNNGSMVIFGGCDDSWWLSTPSISSGILDFRDRGIIIYEMIRRLGENITGGMIRTTGNFSNGNSNFHPLGGTIELYGSLDRNVTSGIFHDLLINKSAPGIIVTSVLSVIEGNLTVQGGTLQLNSDVTVQNEGAVTITNGILNLNHNELISTGDVIVNGTLSLDAGAILKISDGKSVTVNDGGLLQTIGTSVSLAQITHNASGFYALNVESGGMISACQTIFENTNSEGIHIKSGALVHSANSLDYCTFRYGISGGNLLTVNSSQYITVNAASFPSNAGNGAKNVAKTSDQGCVYFTNFSGTFSGPAFENDPHNRVFWQGVQEPLVMDLLGHYYMADFQITLTWNFVQPANFFNIWGSPDPYGEYVLLGTSSSTSWTGAIPGERYFYRITAVLP